MATPSVSTVRREALQPHLDATEFLFTMRKITAAALVILGLLILSLAAFTLSKFITTLDLMPRETIQMLFMTAIMTLATGFHLSKQNTLATQITTGPLSFEI